MRRDLQRASPQPLLLLWLGSGSGGTANAPFIHFLHVTE
jgi:hypothetical protein